MDDAMKTTQSPLAQFCSACGHKLQDNMKFCGGCGLSLFSDAPGFGGTPQSDQSADAAGVQINDQNLTLAQGWAYYFGGLAVLVLIGWLLGSMVVIGYLAIGAFMSRHVMRHLVEWHPMYDTLYNVTSAKLWMFVLWPLQMFTLLFRLTVNRVL